MVEAYPLKWPKGWPRTESPERSRFKDITLPRAEQEVEDELNRLGAGNIVINSNIVRSAQPPDRGVVVYFTLKDRQQSIPCDRWDRVEHNIHAIALTIEALRGIDRWGAKSMVDAAFQGFTALPAPEQTRTPREIIGVSEDMSDFDYITFKFKTRAKLLHPDSGGNPKQMQELNEAYQALKKELSEDK